MVELSVNILLRVVGAIIRWWQRRKYLVRAGGDVIGSWVARGVAGILVSGAHYGDNILNMFLKQHKVLRCVCVKSKCAT